MKTTTSLIAEMSRPDAVNPSLQAVHTSGLMMRLQFSVKHEKGNDGMEELNGMTKEQLKDELRFMRKKAVTSGILAGCAAVAAIFTIITEYLIVVAGFLVIAVVFGIRARQAAQCAGEIKRRIEHETETDQINAELRSMRTKVLVMRILTHGFTVTGFLSLFITQNVLIMVCFWIIALAFGIPTGRAIKKRNKIKDRLVAHVAGCVLRNGLGDDVEYKPSGELKPDKEAAPFCFPAEKNKIWRTYGWYSIKAAYNGLNIELGNIYIDEKESGWQWDEASFGGRVLFNGPWLICDFGRKPACTVTVSARNNFFSKEKRAVTIDNKQFSSRFCVNAEDPQEAFKILTPQMMDTISAVADKSGGQVYISFMPDGKMHVGINTWCALFDARKYNDAEEIRQKFSEEVRRITVILDILNVREENV
ncbi:MAG: DUF3137 domain-containing protein [Faecousia sp.]